MPYAICRVDGCTNKAFFGIKCHRTHCADHKTHDMKFKKNSGSCVYGDCMTKASYGPPGDKKKIYCAKHKLDGDVPGSTKNTCIYNGCTNPATYRSTDKFTHCKQHKIIGMTTSKKCQQLGCNNNALYGFNNSLSHCYEHKQNGMLREKVCQYEGCEVKASFGFDNKYTRCSQHKIDGMTGKRRKEVVCHIEGCTEKASFGIDGQCTHCKMHKTKDMIPKYRRIQKLCMHEGCTILASFGNDNKASHCAKHKSEDMLPVNKKLCTVDGCKNTATYGYGCKTHCSKHKLDNMERQKISGACQYENCTTIASFGLNGKITHCVQHKTTNMVSKSKGTCIVDNCDGTASYGFDGRRTHCSLHREVNMTSYNNCSVCMCPSFKYYYDETTNSRYCYRCFLFTFPDANKDKKFKVKEHHVRDFLEDTYPIVTMIFDKTINGGCSLKRPDVMIDMYTHTILVEIDEDQHKSYDQLCDNKRTMELFNDLGNRPIVFIRFNPDDYICSSGKRHSSCFAAHKLLGVQCIDNEQFSQRLQCMKTVIDYYLNEIPSKEITIIKLFFDGFDIQNYNA
jgi:hypothetical protein